MESEFGSQVFREVRNREILSGSIYQLVDQLK